MSTLKERLIAGATIVGTVVGSVAFGYNIGNDTNDGLVNFLREKSQIADKAETQLRAEVSSLKLELQSSKNSAVPMPVTLAAGASTAAASVAIKPSVDTSTERVILQKGQSTGPFNGKLIVSLVGTSYEGNPLRYKVIATVGSPGKDNKSLEKVDVGFAVLFQGYEVRVIASDTFSATFLVTRVEGKT